MNPQTVIDSYGWDFSKSVLLNTLFDNRYQTLGYYGYWTSALLIASIPFSLITDKILGQKRSIYIGGLISLLGYSLLLIQNQYTLFLSIILILIGTSFVKPSTTILVGRQFRKENKDRTLAYMIYFMGINIGAFIGVAGIGYIGEVYNWKCGFAIAALSTLTYILLAFILRSQINELETNTLSNTNHELTLKKSVLILPLLILINVVFWKSHELESTEFIANLSISNDQTFFGYTMLKSMFHSLTSIWTIPFTIIVFIFWYSKEVTDVFKSICISFILLIIAIVATKVFQNIDTNNLLELAMIPLGFYALAEVIVSPILTSYVTRISDVNYSNTIYSVYIFFTYLIGAGFVYILHNDFQTYSIIAILAITIITLIIYKNQIRKLTCELK